MLTVGVLYFRECCYLVIETAEKTRKHIHMQRESNYQPSFIKTFHDQKPLTIQLN